MGREKIFITSEGEKRWEDVERALQRLARRGQKVAEALLPPVPVSTYCEKCKGSERFMCFMTPGDGRICSGAIHIGEIGKIDGSQPKSVTIIVSIYPPVGSKNGVMKQEIVCKQGINIMSHEIEVKAFSLITAELMEGEPEIKDIHVTMGFCGSVKEAVVMDFLIDELEKVMLSYTKEEE